MDVTVPYICSLRCYNRLYKPQIFQQNSAVNSFWTREIGKNASGSGLSLPSAWRRSKYRFGFDVMSRYLHKDIEFTCEKPPPCFLLEGVSYSAANFEWRYLPTVFQLVRGFVLRYYCRDTTGWRKWRNAIGRAGRKMRLSILIRCLLTSIQVDRAFFPFRRH